MQKKMQYSELEEQLYRVRRGNFLIWKDHKTIIIGNVILIFVFLHRGTFKVFFYYFLKIISWRWPPFWSIHWESRNRKFCSTFSSVPVSMLAIAARILFFSIPKVFGRLVYTKDLRYPHKKKSQGAKSGERAGQSRSPLKEIRRSGKCSRKRAIDVRAVWAWSLLN